MKVRELMSKDVTSVQTGTMVAEVAKTMKNENVGSVPVCSNGRVVGIITDRDIVIRKIAEGTNAATTKAEEVMTPGVVTVSSNMDIHDAAKLMSDKQIRRLPVVDNGTLVGMLAIGDIAVRSKLVDDAGDALGEISETNHTVY